MRAFGSNFDDMFGVYFLVLEEDLGALFSFTETFTHECVIPRSP